MPHLSHTCNAKRPSAAAAVTPWATRLRAPGGSTGKRVRRIGFLRFGFVRGAVICWPFLEPRRRCTAPGRS